MSNPTSIVLAVFMALLLLRMAGTGRLKAVWETAFAP